MNILSAKDLSDDPKERIKEVYKIAREVWGDNVIMAQVATGQAILESSILKDKVSGLALQNNLFGIKGHGTAGATTKNTFEWIRGQMVQVKDGFAVNRTLLDSFEQHRELLTNKDRYVAVVNAKSLKEATAALQASGYATDPKYGHKVYLCVIKWVLSD